VLVDLELDDFDRDEFDRVRAEADRELVEPREWGAEDVRVAMIARLRHRLTCHMRHTPDSCWRAAGVPAALRPPAPPE
jgi:hypothetical protein